MPNKRPPFHENERISKKSKISNTLEKKCEDFDSNEQVDMCEIVDVVDETDEGEEDEEIEDVKDDCADADEGVMDKSVLENCIS